MCPTGAGRQRSPMPLVGVGLVVDDDDAVVDVVDVAFSVCVVGAIIPIHDSLAYNPRLDIPNHCSRRPSWMLVKRDAVAGDDVVVTASRDEDGRIQRCCRLRCDCHFVDLIHSQSAGVSIV